MTKPAKYLSIAQKLIADIEGGKLEINSKLPSLRTFTNLHNISMTTALACYRHLEKYGYVIAEYKKGYYVQKPSIMDNPAKNIVNFPSFQSEITEHITRTHAHQGIVNTYSLGTAQIDKELIDYPILKRCLRETTRQHDFKVGYDDPKGNAQLRTHLSSHFTKQGFPCNSDDLIITHGCLDAVLIALECVSKPGDVIAVSSPCYSGLLDILAVLNRAVIEIPSTKNGIDLSQLEQAMKTKKVAACLLTANYQNPSGHSLTNQQKQTLALLANEHQVPIIEDDVFRELSHQQSIPLPIKYFDQQGWVIWCSSVSKTLAPGFRIGWCSSGRFQEQFIYQRRVRTIGHNQPMQLALAGYIGNGYYEKHIKKINRTLVKHSAKYIELLQQHLPNSAEVSTPAGGLVLWIRVPNLDSVQLTKKLANEHIFIQPGNMFSTTGLYEDCFRLNIGQIPTDNIVEQLHTICKLVNNKSSL